MALIRSRNTPPRYRLETLGGALVDTRSGGLYAHRSQADIDARATVAATGKAVVIRERRAGKYVELRRIEVDDVIVVLVPTPKLHERTSPAWFEELAESCEAHARRWSEPHPPAAQIVAYGIAAAWAAEARRARDSAETLRNNKRSKTLS